MTRAETATPVEGREERPVVLGPRVRLMLILTFLPFLWKAGGYALLGSYLPLVVFLLFATIVAAGLSAGPAWARRVVRTWCVAMVVWAMTRLVVILMVRVADLNDAHLRSQLNVPFVLASLVYIAVGIVLYRMSGAHDLDRAP